MPWRNLMKDKLMDCAKITLPLFACSTCYAKTRPLSNGKIIFAQTLTVSLVIIGSLVFGTLLADPDSARKQAADNASILYKASDPNDPTNWNFYFGPTEQEAAANPIANRKRQVMQSYFLDKKFPEQQIQRNVSWLFEPSMQMQMYQQGVIPTTEQTTTTSTHGDSTSTTTSDTSNNYGY
jgi:hypothetical protein